MLDDLTELHMHDITGRRQKIAAWENELYVMVNHGNNYELYVIVNHGNN